MDRDLNNFNPGCVALLSLPTFDLCLLAGQVADRYQPVHTVPGDQRLFQLPKEQLQRSGQHVHIVHGLQHGRVAVIHLQAQPLHHRQVPRLPINTVCRQIFHPTLNDRDALFHKQRHIAVVRFGEEEEGGPEDRLVLHDAALHEVLDGGPAEEEFAEFLPYAGLLLDKGRDGASLRGVRGGRQVVTQLLAGGQQLQLQRFRPSHLKNYKKMLIQYRDAEFVSLKNIIFA